MSVTDTGVVDGVISQRDRENARRRKRIALTFMLLGPAVIWIVAFFVTPLGRMLWESIRYEDAYSLYHYERFFSTTLYLKVTLTTFKIAIITTVGCLVLGYPPAYFLATTKSRFRGVLLLLILIPYWLDYIVRSYSWMVLLGRNGLVNDVLVALGLFETRTSFLNTTFSVCVGMIQILLPLMVLTLFAAMLRIDQDLMRAAAAHGAGRWRAFRWVFFPLSLPGVYAASLLVFIIALGFYITPALLGGPKDTMISQTIEVLANYLIDWPLAAAASAVLLVVSTAILYVYNRFFGIDRLWGGTET